MTKSLQELEQRVDVVDAKAEKALGRATEAFKTLAGDLEKPGVVHQLNDLLRIIREVRRNTWVVITGVVVGVAVDLIVRLATRA